MWAGHTQDSETGLQVSRLLQARHMDDRMLFYTNVIKQAHSKHLPALFLKLDFARAFDSVSWPYLLDVLARMGFGPRWRDMIALLLSSASSRVLLNGIPGRPFLHRRGLRQGDPLSPMLFIIAMEPLQLLLRKATVEGVLNPVTPRAAKIQVSMYADDVALFVNPLRQDVAVVKSILRSFGLASRLVINPDKCVAYPIRCDGMDLQVILQDFSCPLGSLPCKYLGLPLGFRKPRRVEVQPLIDKLASKSKGWLGRLMAKPGRLALINSVLSSTTAYFPVNPWAVKKMDKIRRNFLWDIEEGTNGGGKCMVSWKRICSPKSVGGLGIKDLMAFSRALRLRWLWFQWGNEERPWKGMDVPCDNSDKQLFSACTQIELGNGEKCKFWTDRWLDGMAPQFLTPLLFPLARRKNLLVKEALAGGRWMKGLERMGLAEHLDQFFSLWQRIQEVHLTDRPDSIRWSLTSDGCYSAKSAYEFQFKTCIPLPHLDQIWKIRAESKIKFHCWLLLQGRLWTADRLQSRGLPNQDVCPFCDQLQESAVHISILCPFAREVWHAFSRDFGQMAAIGSSSASLICWWNRLWKLNKSKITKTRVTTTVYVVWNL